MAKKFIIPHENLKIYSKITFKSKKSVIVLIVKFTNQRTSILALKNIIHN
jgi:hypothetical protein